MPVPNSKREQIIQAARTWATDVLSLADAPNQIIPQAQGEDSGEAPNNDYMVVFFEAIGGDIGPPEHYHLLDDGSPVAVRRLHKTGTLSIQGYGDSCEEWLETLQMFTDLFPEEAGVLARVLAIVDVTVENEERVLERIQRVDFLIEYHVEAARTVVAATTAVIDLTIDGQTTTITGDLP